MRGPGREAQGDQSNRESTPEADNSAVDSFEGRAEAETLEADTRYDTMHGRYKEAERRAGPLCNAHAVPNLSKNKKAMTTISRMIVNLITCTMKRR